VLLCWKVFVSLSLMFFLFSPLHSDLTLEAIQEECLLPLRLHGFLDPKIQERHVVGSEALLLHSVVLPGMLREVSFQVLASRQATLSLDVLQKDELKRFSLPVPTADSWRQVEWIVPAGALDHESIRLKDLRIEEVGEGASLELAIKDFTCTLWVPRDVRVQSEVRLLKPIPLLLETDPLRMELRLFNASEREIPHRLHALIDSRYGSLERKDFGTFMAEETSLSRFDLVLDGLGLGIHRFLVKELVEEKEQILLDTNMAVLPEMSAVETPAMMILSEETLPVLLNRFQVDSPKSTSHKVGWSTPRSRDGLSEEDQAWRLAEAYLTSAISGDSSPWLWSEWRDRQQGGGGGLVTLDGQPKMGLSMLCSLASTVIEPMDQISSQDQDLQGFRFFHPKGFGWALWTEGPQKGIAIHASRGTARVMRGDGTFGNLLPESLGPEPAWVLHCVGDHPTILLDPVDEPTDWMPLIVSRGMRDVVEGGKAFKVRYRLSVPAGLRLRGTLLPTHPPEWKAVPERMDLDQAGPGEKDFVIQWKPPWPGQDQKARLELSLALAGGTSPQCLWSYPVRLLSVLEGNVEGSFQGDQVFFLAKIRALDRSSPHGTLSLKIGGAEPVNREFGPLKKGTEYEMQARMPWPPEMSRILDLPAILSLHTQRGAVRMPFRVMASEVPMGSIRVDGRWEEWDGARTVELGLLGDVFSFSQDATPTPGRAYFLWNEEGLCIGVRMEDAVVSEEDGLELVVRADKGKTRFLRFPLTCPPGTPLAGVGGTLFAWNDLEDEVVYELLLPWSYLDINPAKEESDRVLSLSLGVCDSDHAGVKTMTGWGVQGWAGEDVPTPRVRLTLTPSETSR